MKQRTVGIKLHDGLAIFPLTSFYDRSPIMPANQLCPIADAQNRDIQFKHLRITGRRILAVHTGGASGKNNSFWILLPDPADGRVKRQDFTIYIRLPDSSGNQLVVLSSKIQHKNGFL